MHGRPLAWDGLLIPGGPLRFWQPYALLDWDRSLAVLFPASLVGLLLSSTFFSWVTCLLVRFSLWFLLVVAIHFLSSDFFLGFFVDHSFFDFFPWFCSVLGAAVLDTLGSC